MLRYPMNTFRPYWFDEALKREGAPQPRPLTEDITADVCIVGGGYTGLWTALELKERQEDLDVVVIEQDLCGHGASGCNGGCVLTLATKFLSLSRFYGRDEARRLVLASEAAVRHLSEFTQVHRIACDLRLDGALYIATNPAQVGAMRPVMTALQAEGISSWSPRTVEEARELAGTRRILEAFHSPCAGSVQPASLVRGMLRVAREKGIRVFEGTPMTRLDSTRSPQVYTPHGRIASKKVVLAINAWMATTFPQFARSIVVVSSDMGITPPIPQLLDRIGLVHGASICDLRIFVHYFRTTTDGRLMLGKGGNTFAFRSRMIPSFFQPSLYEQQIVGAMRSFYPKLRDIELVQAWNGGSDRSRTGFPFFGRLNGHPDIFYGFGYSGNGVTQSVLGGKILASLTLDANDQWSRCGFVGGPRGLFPPEPVRWLGAMTVRNAIRRKEAAEDAGRAPRWLDTRLARFAAAAGKADK
jgi:putative aminophosphonate oxidoreductase